MCFLKNKYKTREALEKAWAGKESLLPEEDWNKNSIKPLGFRNPGTSAETDYAASTEETRAATEKETEESTETATEEQTEPVSELVEGDVIEIDGKKHKVVDFDDEIDAMYNTMGSYLDLKESKIPEKLKNIPENWETVTRYGISLKVPTGFTETEMDGNPMFTVCTEDGTEVEIAFSLVEETEETLQSPEEIEKITEKRYQKTDTFYFYYLLSA